MRRRRRLIQDGEGESVAEESLAATEAAASSATGKRPYGEDVQAALAATVADLPPRGWLALSGWLATGLLLAAGVTAIYVLMLRRLVRNYRRRREGGQAQQ